MSQSVKIKVVTGKVRFSYVSVFQPTAGVDGGSPKYRCSIIVPKSDKATVDKLNKAFNDCKTQNAAFFGGKVPPVLKGGLRDGDVEKPGDPAYANCYFFNANSAQKPGVVDADLNAIMDPEEFYSGCYGRASVTLYPYNSAGSKGIAYGLANVQKTEEGERLGGVSNAAADFAV